MENEVWAFIHQAITLWGFMPWWVHNYTRIAFFFAVVFFLVEARHAVSWLRKALDSKIKLWYPAWMRFFLLVEQDEKGVVLSPAIARPVIFMQFAALLCFDLLMACIVGVACPVYFVVIIYPFVNKLMAIVEPILLGLPGAYVFALAKQRQALEVVEEIGDAKEKEKEKPKTKK